jgi:hypothetical protein
MIIRYALALSSLALVLSAGPSYSGPCTQQILDVRNAGKEKQSARITAGGSAAESTGATLHHQPTPNSVGEAQVQLGEISEKDKVAFLQAIERANAAGEANNLAECEKALTEARGIVSAYP